MKKKDHKNKNGAHGFFGYVGMFFFLWLAMVPQAHATTGCTVLFYYDSADSNGEAVTHIVNDVLIPMGATVTTVQVTTTTFCPGGAGEGAWTNYNQVWDARFYSGSINHCTSYTQQADYFATCWQTTAVSYLEAGGNFFLQGENDGFPSRNMGDYPFLTTCGVLNSSFQQCPDGNANANDDNSNGGDTLTGINSMAGQSLYADNFGGIPLADLAIPAESAVNYTGGWINSGNMTRSVAQACAGASGLPGLTGSTIGNLFVVWDQTGWTGSDYTNNKGTMVAFYDAVYTWLNGTSCGPTNTMTSSPTPMITNTQTATATQTQTVTFTPTQTNTASPTGLATNTMTSTATASTTPTMTNTPTISPTSTNSPTFTPTITPTPGLYAWPNPFNPQTSRDHVFKIGYVPQASHLAFYTVSGELVIDSASGGKNLQYGTLPAPEDSGWMWTGANSNGLYVATGIYYYILQKGTGNSGSVLLNGKVLVVNGQ